MKEKTLIDEGAGASVDCFRFREDYLFFGLLVRHGLCQPANHAALVRIQASGDPPLPLARLLADKSNLTEKTRADVQELLDILANPKLADLLPAEFSELHTLVGESETTTPNLTAAAPTHRVDDPAASPIEAGVTVRDSQYVELDRTVPLGTSPTLAVDPDAASHLSPDEITRVQRAVSKGPMIGRMMHGHVIIDRLGGGGQGEVYLAKQLSLNRYVALKKLEIPQPAAAHQFLAMFRSEARTLGAINHARIVKVFEIFEEAGGAVFTMEYLKGRSLGDIVKSSGGPMPLDVVANLACQACSALSRTAGDGLVHRDIKPANMMLDENGDLKIVDFGLATAASAFRPAGSFSGTVQYASPEQVKLETLTPASDQYSLGITLFYALTGELPFKAATVHDMMRMHVHEPPPTPSSRNPELPPAVDRVLLRMMAKEPARRFKDFDECFGAWEAVLQQVSRRPAAAASQLLGESLLRFSREEERTILRRSLWLAAAWVLVVAGAVLGEYRLRARGLGWFLDACGTWGTALLVFSLSCIFYVAAARKKWLPTVGSLRAWLYTHIATAVPAVAMLLVHSGHFLYGIAPGPPSAKPLLSIIMAAVLLATAVSGSVGLLIFRQLRRRLQLDELELRGTVADPRQAMMLVLGARFLSGWRLVHYPLAVFFILMSLAHIVNWLRFRVG